MMRPVVGMARMRLCRRSGCQRPQRGRDRVATRSRQSRNEVATESQRGRDRVAMRSRQSRNEVATRWNMARPRVIYEAKPGSPLDVDRKLYSRLAEETASRTLVD